MSDKMPFLIFGIVFLAGFYVRRLKRKVNKLEEDAITLARKLEEATPKFHRWVDLSFLDGTRARLPVVFIDEVHHGCTVRREFVCAKLDYRDGLMLATGMKIPVNNWYNGTFPTIGLVLDPARLNELRSRAIETKLAARTSGYNDDLF